MTKDLKWKYLSLQSFVLTKYSVVGFWRKNVHKYWLKAPRTKPAQDKYD